MSLGQHKTHKYILADNILADYTEKKNLFVF